MPIVPILIALGVVALAVFSFAGVTVAVFATIWAVSRFQQRERANLEAAVDAHFAAQAEPELPTPPAAVRTGKVTPAVVELALA